MMVRVAVVLLLLALLPSTALADKRVALVIGNSAYKHAGELANPKNDAADMAAALKKLGFQVIDGFDLDKASLDRKIRDFATALSGADVGLFFYAGHGLQVAGQNYIVPVDAQLTTASALEFEMVRLDLVHRIMEREAQTNILFLDACRNNPLARNLARVMGTRSGEIGRGLAAVESGSGTLISFSTQPGNVASDGSGRNSPFTGPLVKHITSSNEDLSAVLIAVRNDVMNETQKKQVPWEHSALTKRIYFNTAAQAARPASTASTGSLSEAAQTWAVVKDTTDQSVLEAFAKQFGETVYGAMARSKLTELKKQQVASLPARPGVPPKTDPLKAAAATNPMPAPVDENKRQEELGRIRVQAIAKRLAGAVYLRKIRNQYASGDVYYTFQSDTSVRIEERDFKTGKIRSYQLKILHNPEYADENHFNLAPAIVLELSTDLKSLRVLVSTLGAEEGEVWTRQ